MGGTVMKGGVERRGRRRVISRGENVGGKKGGCEE